MAKIQQWLKSSPKIQLYLFNTVL